ncbi:MAG TPA: NADH-ubiquinone oxidoreductase-F iron-sulfur binding region domain-containing protein [Streptosporangiaceae bacterium]
MTQSVQPAIWIGQGRLTAGLDRFPRLDLITHRSIFGPAPVAGAAQLVSLCDQVDLRGRGGAAFASARKIRAVVAACQRTGRRPVVVVNGTEGEPGSAKDKMLLTRSPHLVLDGALLAARALHATEVIVAVAGDGPHVESVIDAVDSDRSISRITRVVSLPDRFVSGESGALVNGINGNPALPPGIKTRASDAGVGGAPTLLSNAETFAQLAILGMLGAAGYSSTGDPDEPGTVLLTVGGDVQRPAVVETPTGVPLGHILDICGAQQPAGVLVGGYHGMWLSPEAAYDVPVSRSGMSAGGGTLGAGIVLVLGQDTCPLGEVARVAGYMAMQSSGQCGPCKLGLPAVARSLAAVAAGAGGVDELEAVRRAAAGVRGRGACAHPDGTANFVASALDVFGADLSEHLFRGSCGKRTTGVLPVDHAPGDAKLSVDWTRCQGHGLCGHLVPELIQLDEHGYPAFLEVNVPFWLTKVVRQAVDSCPALALTMTTLSGRSAAPALPAPERRSPPVITTSIPVRPAIGPPTRRAIEAPARRPADFSVTSAWIAELGGGR